MTTMNYSIAIFFFNPKCRAVVGIYEPEPIEGTKKNPNNRTIFKTLDPNIKIDDVVVVPCGTRHGFTTFKIVEVDIRIDIDYTPEVKWIVEKVDMEKYDKIKAIEQEGVDKIKQHEANKKREELRIAMGFNNEEFKALPMATLNDEGAFTKKRKG